MAGRWPQGSKRQLPEWVAGHGAVQCLLLLRHLAWCATNPSGDANQLPMHGTAQGSKRERGQQACTKEAVLHHCPTPRHKS